MISKRKKIVVALSITLLLLCTLMALMNAWFSYSAVPTLLNRSTHAFIDKLTEDDRASICLQVRHLVRIDSMAFSIVIALWALFACLVIWFWSKSSQTRLNHD